MEIAAYKVMYWVSQ